MTIIDQLEGSWSGYGRVLDGENEKDLDLVKVSISLDRESDSKLVGYKKMEFTNEPDKNYEIEVQLEVINEMELNVKREGMEAPITYMYMDQPVSFQGSYISEALGENTRNLDNNFILDDQWQVNVESQSNESHVIIEYVLENDSL